MARSGNVTASACHRWRERWSLVWREGVASQNLHLKFKYGIPLIMAVQVGLLLCLMTRA